MQSTNLISACHSLLRLARVDLRHATSGSGCDTPRRAPGRLRRAAPAPAAPPAAVPAGSSPSPATTALARANKLQHKATEAQRAYARRSYQLATVAPSTPPSELTSAATTAARLVRLHHPRTSCNHASAAGFARCSRASLRARSRRPASATPAAAHLRPPRPTPAAPRSAPVRLAKIRLRHCRRRLYASPSSDFRLRHRRPCRPHHHRLRPMLPLNRFSLRASTMPVAAAPAPFYWQAGPATRAPTSTRAPRCATHGAPCRPAPLPLPSSYSHEGEKEGKWGARCGRVEKSRGKRKTNKRRRGGVGWRGACRLKLRKRINK